MLKDQIILTCEHATNFIPKKYRGFFPLNKKVKGRWGNEKTKDVLNEHWGWDVGALNLAKYLSKKLNIPLHFFPVSRLLIEGNRYFLRSLFEEFTRNLPDELKTACLQSMENQPAASDGFSPSEAVPCDGLPEEFSRLGTPVVIPHTKGIDSLNLSSAVAIAAYAAYTQN